MTAAAFMDRARRCGLTLAECKAALLTAPAYTGVPLSQLEESIRGAYTALQTTTAEVAAALAKAGITLREEVPS